MNGNMDGVIRSITAVIVDQCDPDRIVLFGSWAKGTVHRYSDIDLLVIGPFTESRWLRGRDVREALGRFPVAIDLHCITQSEFDTEAAKSFTYLNTLQSTSRVLYERQLLT